MDSDFETESRSTQRTISSARRRLVFVTSANIALRIVTDWQSLKSCAYKRNRSSLANSWCAMYREAQMRAASSAPAFAAIQVLKRSSLDAIRPFIAAQAFTGEIA